MQVAHQRSSAALPAHGYRSAWSRCRRGRAASAPRAGRRRCAAGGWRRRGAARAGRAAPPRCRSARASALSSRAKCWRVRWPGSPNDGNSHFDCARLVCRPSARSFEILRHRALGRLVERHQPLLAAFAAHHQHALIAPRGRGRQRHQFGDAQAGGVDDFEQAQQPRRAQACGRRAASHLRHRCAPAPASASTSAIDRTFGSAAPALGPFQHRRRIVAAFSFGVEETIKLAHRRQPPRQRRGLEAALGERSREIRAGRRSWHWRCCGRPRADARSRSARSLR